METQIFHHAKIYLIFKKIPLKETKILQYIIINLKFQHKPKYYLSNPKPTENPILLNIENNGPFLPFPLVLSNSHKPTKPYYRFNC